MRGVTRSDPKFSAVYSDLNARPEPKTPRDICQLKFEAFFGQNQIPGGIAELEREAFFSSEPKLLAVFTNLNARRYSVGTETPGDISQSRCEAAFGQIPNSWRNLPVLTRRVFQSGPKSLAIFTALNARRFSVRTEAPGGFFQFKCEALFGQGQNPRQYLPVEMRGAFGSEPDFLAIFPRVAAGHFSCEAFV